MVELTALSSRIDRAKALFKVLCFTSSVTRFFRGGENYYIYFVDSLSLYPTVKNFQNWLTVDEVITKMRQHVFLRHTV